MESMTTIFARPSRRLVERFPSTGKTNGTGPIVLRLIDDEDKIFVRAEGIEPASDCVFRPIFRVQNQRGNLARPASPAPPSRNPSFPSARDPSQKFMLTRAARRTQVSRSQRSPQNPRFGSRLRYSPECRSGFFVATSAAWAETKLRFHSG